LGLEWSQAREIADYIAPGDPGVYRIFTELEMYYCGESSDLHSRIKSHKRNPSFSNCYVSVHTMPNCKPHHLKEREVDLFGAYTAEQGKGPIHQYTKGK
jgi:hypothetical protein